MSLKTYVQDSIKEFNNVTWPTRAQAIRITIVVFVFMIISAFALGFVDQILTQGYQYLLSL